MITPVLHCPYCHGTDIVRHGTTSEGKQRYRWREYDPEDSVRFYALRLHEVGMIKSSPRSSSPRARTGASSTR
jgi:hypothetical protein